MSRTMDSLPPNKKDAIMELKNTLGTMVHSYFQCLTAEQWELLKSCTPDEATSHQMSELLLQILNTLSNVFLNPAWRNMFSEEDIQAHLGNLVTDTFKIALDINDDVQCESADNLLKLINEEVADRLNHPESALPAHPKTLHMMVMHAVEMTKNFLGRVKKVVTCQSARRSLTADQEMEMIKEVEMSFIENFGMKSNEIIKPLLEEDRTEGGKSLSNLESESKKSFMQVIIEKLFTRIFKEAKDCNINEHRDILLRLIERSWPQVKGFDFELSLKNLQNFDKLIFKDVCKQLGCADQVLLSLKREDDAIINSIATVFKCSVAPKTTMLQRICNFFTSSCQRRQRVGVVEDPAEVVKVPSDEIEPEPTMKMKKEMFVEVVVEKLFSRIVNTKVDCTKIEPKDILLHLFERTLVEVEGVDFEFSEKNLSNLDKIIFKDLCKKLRSADQVLISLRMEDDAIVTSIVYAIKCSVTPKKTEK